MAHGNLIDDDWELVLSLLAPAIDLEESARSNGALHRKREIRDGATLLRLNLAYGAVGLSLRQACGWAEVAGLASLSDPALLKRISGSAGWLQAIAEALLKAWLPAGCERWRGWRLRLMDATAICHPGADRTSWRLHLGWSLEAGRIDRLELTDGRGAESLSRADCGPGVIALGDRGYARPGDLFDAAACGGGLIIRTGWNALRLLDGSGAVLDVCALLDQVPGDVGEFPVWLDHHRPGAPPLPLRLVIRRQSAADAERARRRVRKRGKKVGKQPDRRSLKAAGFVMLLSNLPADSFPADDLLVLYRLRWQIELVFKRLKSLLGLGNLPAKNQALARAWIWAKLILALLIESLATKVLDSPPCADTKLPLPAVHLAPVPAHPN